jgi:hypothetical protein
LLAVPNANRNDKLKNALSESQFLVVETQSPACLIDIVERMEPWMSAGLGEGIVINLGSKLAKWKSSCENQGKTCQLLQSAIKVACYLSDQNITAALRTMLNVAQKYKPAQNSKLG